MVIHRLIMKYLSAYPQNLQTQVQQLQDQGKLGAMLLKKYPQAHGVRTDKALYDYVMTLKNEFLRSSEPLSKIAYDNRLQVIAHALGTHTTISRVQGNKLKAKREIRVASLFKEAPLEFLKMITVHELAHIKEKGHDKNFYKLCTYMEPEYHQYEFDLRVYLTHMDVSGKLAWAGLTAAPDAVNTTNAAPS
ncbi:UTP pyrophosphatase [Polaromonas vacuolata]|uniref:UTP pyrophosphatase n=2 Tax=Polaromonas vacuolata TaxID=37448 RepID=A0A6H2H828_9BURK|nr:UTP pyrophosphatase [Polaromonas vacuolata]